MLVDKVGKSGNVYGKKSVDKDLTKTIKSVSRKTDTLFLLGPDVIYKAPSLAVKAIELLKKSGTGFTVLEKEPNTGAALYFLLGEVGETREAAEKAATVLNNYEKIIIYEPFEAKVIIQQYRAWGIRLTAKICTFTAFLSELMKINCLNRKTKEKYTTRIISLQEILRNKPGRKHIACGFYSLTLLPWEGNFPQATDHEQYIRVIRDCFKTMGTCTVTERYMITSSRQNISAEATHQRVKSHAT